jgi:hypothetical protein
MERSAGQQLLGAFVVGGIIAVVAQAIMMVVSMIVPVPNLVAPVMLIVLGIVGMVLVLSGNYKKITEIGGFGAGIMFCGLVDAVAGIFVGASMEAGGNASAGMKAAGKFAVSVLGSLVVVGTLLGVVCSGLPGVQAVMAGPTVQAPGPIVFLYAFLMGGAISIEGQALLTFAKLPDPVVVLINAALGMLLAVLGVAANLEVITGAGLCATVVDAGAGAVLGGAMISVAGVPMVTVILVAVMAIVVAMGVVCGNILLKRATSH